ncbi:MAG: hypothetical protein B7Z05_07220 [Thiotrichales bacterium 32-46-8]|nr:MAG: hypothetical protein B7Z05_07220 [Thiotrichales bacterium 32-46-8]OYY24762.1 MAG: hypothetical protein B7Y68_02490 [Thiotrichales bacterium 35-46-9]OYZ07976.1 MAG: hypothetical protein B7Y29_02870 [Thiotrichales bacterium 16-46-22]OZA17077.1 MAG: hypothetical protein B7X85_05590 [Thiotrichales bacterium 17-46-47]OZA96523.1 MAG: hypothetical protein B7X52_05035 [Thiotrichales bacterium 34-46-19]
MFANRPLLIASQHRKEEVMAPCLTKALGVICQVAENLNTDLLGTFSGEVARLDDPIRTLRKKCMLALEQQTSFDLVVASEGSFGPHPAMFFVPANEEWVMLLDQKHNLEITARSVSMATNFSAKQVHTWSELLAFASAAQFPSHGLILRPSKDTYEPIFKGITTESVLKYAFDCLFDATRGVYAETDMRALYNPSRMKVIEQATQQLIVKTQSTCPQCEMPGFDVVQAKGGLPCSGCGLPTESVLSHIYRCQQCEYHEERCFPYGKEVEEPRYCHFCNP